VYAGSKCLLDYSATKGAITAFTRSLALNLVKQGIRVNAVAPGPVWTPLNSFGGPSAAPGRGRHHVELSVRTGLTGSPLAP
jgi:NAD(P)-dependent dehydrogenase (short-subunit alcohol dehydrogenase family)